MHGQWMQKTFGKAQKRAKRASWSWGRSSCEVLEILENHILMVFIWKICQLPGKRTLCVDAEATLCHFDWGMACPRTKNSGRRGFNGWNPGIWKTRQFGISTRRWGHGHPMQLKPRYQMVSACTSSEGCCNGGALFSWDDWDELRLQSQDLMTPQPQAPQRRWGKVERQETPKNA